MLTNVIYSVKTSTWEESVPVYMPYQKFKDAFIFQLPIEGLFWHLTVSKLGKTNVTVTHQIIQIQDAGAST